MSDRFPMRGRFKQTTLANISGGDNQWLFGTTVPTTNGTAIGDIYVMLPPAPFTDNANTAQWPLHMWVWDGVRWDLFAATNGTGDNWGTNSYFNQNVASFGVTINTGAINPFDQTFVAPTFGTTQVKHGYYNSATYLN